MRRIVFTLALAASGLLAQVSPPGPLVRLYPVALDDKGTPVTDLTADDFKIVDQTKAETILAFRKPKTGPAAAHDVLEFSNRASGAAPHSTVILFDMINLADSDRLENWKALDKALPQLESGDHLYFYALNLEGVLTPLHKIGPAAPDDKTWPQSVVAPFDKFMKANSHVRAAQIGAEEQQKRTFKALEDLANMLALLPGRRDIVWIANGVTTVSDPKLTSCNGDWVECALYVPHLAVTLAKAGVAVDPYVLIGSVTPEVNYNMDQMSLLTGGHYYSRQEVQAVVNQVTQTAISSYSILYDPGADNWNNKWHRLHVTCERKGVKVQLRERYYAVSDSRSGVDRMRAALTEAFQSPTDLTDIGVSTKISLMPDGKQGMHLDIKIDPADLVLHEQGGKYTGALYCLISDRSATAGLGEPTVLNLTPELTADQYKAAMKDGLPMSQDHPTANGTVEIRVIILDQNTDLAGSVTFPVK